MPKVARNPPAATEHHRHVMAAPCAGNVSPCAMKMPRCVNSFPDPNDSPPGLWIGTAEMITMSKKPPSTGTFRDLSWFIPQNPLHDRYLSEWYTDDISPWSSISPRMSLEWTWQQPPTEPASRSAASDFSAMACHRIFQLKMQQCRSELFVHYGYVCLKCALCVVYIHIHLYIYMFLMCLYMCTST